MNDSLSIADIVGPWTDSDFDSGLVRRCRDAWNKPITKLTNEELATLLRQRIAVQHLLPIAKQRVNSGFGDGTEMYDGELQIAIDYAEKFIEPGDRGEPPP